MKLVPIILALIVNCVAGSPRMYGYVIPANTIVKIVFQNWIRQPCFVNILFGSEQLPKQDFKLLSQTVPFLDWTPRDPNSRFQFWRKMYNRVIGSGRWTRYRFREFNEPILIKNGMFIPNTKILVKGLGTLIVKSLDDYTAQNLDVTYATFGQIKFFLTDANHVEILVYKEKLSGTGRSRPTHGESSSSQSDIEWELLKPDLISNKLWM